MSSLTVTQAGAVGITITQPDTGAAITLAPGGAAAVTVAVPGSIGGPQGAAGPAGPQGPPGPAGPPGVGSSIAYNVPFTGSGAGQSVSLPAAPSASPLMLLIVQGLVESPSNYAVSGATLVIPPGLVWDGAECQFVFS